MPLTIPAPSAPIARAIVERFPDLAVSQEADVIFRDTPRRGEPGIYKALNGELALATQGVTQAQCSFLADLFQGEFTQYRGQDAPYFKTQRPAFHLSSHLTSSSTPKQTAVPPLLPVEALSEAATLTPTLSFTLPAELSRVLRERLPDLVTETPTGVMFQAAQERGKAGLYIAKGGELALSTASLGTAEKGLLKAIFHGGYRAYWNQDALYFTTPSPQPSSAFIASLAPGATPALADLPRLAELAEIAPLLSEGRPFAAVQMSILRATSDWVTPTVNWIDWKSSDEAVALRDTELLNRATPAQLEKLLTVIRRQERFFEGSIESAYDSNLLGRIAQRAAKLLQPSAQAI